MSTCSNCGRGFYLPEDFRDHLPCESKDQIIDRLIGERDKCRAEVEMLRGVGCNEDGDGPCGACLKCARRERDEARAAYTSVQESYPEVSDVWKRALDEAKLQRDNARSEAVKARAEERDRVIAKLDKLATAYSEHVCDIDDEVCTCEDVHKVIVELRNAIIVGEHDK